MKIRDRILGFFVAKKLLMVPDVVANASVKLDIEEVIQFAKEQEPRVLEVLPAALISFPKTFLHQEKLPKELKDIVSRIKSGCTTGPSYNGINYKDMYRWAKKRLPDARTVPVDQKRVMKSFRLKPSVVKKLRLIAQNKSMTQTELLEAMIESKNL